MGGLLGRLAQRGKNAVNAAKAKKAIKKDWKDGTGGMTVKEAQAYVDNAMDLYTRFNLQADIADDIVDAINSIPDVEEDDNKVKAKIKKWRIDNLDKKISKKGRELKKYAENPNQKVKDFEKSAKALQEFYANKEAREAVTEFLKLKGGKKKEFDTVLITFSILLEVHDGDIYDDNLAQAKALAEIDPDLHTTFIELFENLQVSSKELAKKIQAV